MKKAIQTLKAEIHLILTDPDTTLSAGATRTLNYINTSLEALAAQPAVPEGWKLERFNDLAVKLISPRGAWWTYDPLGSDRLSWELLDTMLSATPPAAQPAPVQEPEYVYTCNGCDTLYREDDVSCDCTVNGLMQFTRHILMPDTTPPNVATPLAAQPAPDLSKLKPENQQQMREWMTDGSFAQRAIDTMFELSQEITALKAAQPANELSRLHSVNEQLNAQLIVANSACDAAIRTAKFQAITNTEMNNLREINVELLSALKGLVSIFSLDSSEIEVLSARSAITKARAA